MLRGNHELAEADLRKLFDTLFKSVYEENRNVSWESDLWKKLLQIIEMSSDAAVSLILCEFEPLQVPYIKGKIPKNSIDDVLPVLEDFVRATLLTGKLADKRVRLLKSGYARAITKLNAQWARDCKQHFPNGRKRKTEIF